MTDLGDGTFQVDSFFDIDYRIDFVGAPGGQLDGLSGSTTGEVRLSVRDRDGAPSHNITIVKEANGDGSTDFEFTGALGTFSLDDDEDPTLPERRTFNNLFEDVYDVAEEERPDATQKRDTWPRPRGFRREVQRCASL